MIKVGDRLTIDGKLVEVTYVMNEKTYSYKPVKEEEKPVKAEVEEAAPKKKRRGN